MLSIPDLTRIFQQFSEDLKNEVPINEESRKCDFPLNIKPQPMKNNYSKNAYQEVGFFFIIINSSKVMPRDLSILVTEFVNLT